MNLVRCVFVLCFSAMSFAAFGAAPGITSPEGDDSYDCLYDPFILGFNPYGTLNAGEGVESAYITKPDGTIVYEAQGITQDTTGWAVSFPLLALNPGDTYYFKVINSQGQSSTRSITCFSSR